MISIEKDYRPSLPPLSSTSSSQIRFTSKRALPHLPRNRLILTAAIVIALGIGLVFRNRLNGKRESSQPNSAAQSLPNAYSLAPSLLPETFSNGSSKPLHEPSRPPLSRANGEDLTNAEHSRGRGTLKVTNGTAYDAVVKIVDSVSKHTRRFVYVRANNDVMIKGIEVCTCVLKFSSGTDWDQSKLKFLRDVTYSKFDNLLEFVETRTEVGVEWAEFEVTLNPVLYGNAPTTSINESDFDDK